LIGPSLKKTMKLRRLSKIESSILKYRVPPPFGLPIQVKGGQHLPKAHEIKVRCYWELFGGTCQEIGNSFASSIHPPSSPQEKKASSSTFQLNE
jgi:hypothetical protein